MTGSNYSWINLKLEVRNSGEGYKGVFAKESVRSGEKLAIVGGKVMFVSEEVGDYGIQIDEEFSVGGCFSDFQHSDEGFFNHSCEPNAGIKGQIFIMAMRDIEKDEEVTFDYAMCLHESKGMPPYRMECLCGKPSCRKVITDKDWKLPELQRKYDAWFSWYLQGKIDKMK